MGLPFSADLPATSVTLLRSHSISAKMLDNNEDPFTAIPSSYDQVSRFQKEREREREQERERGEERKGSSFPPDRANAIE